MECTLNAVFAEDLGQTDIKIPSVVIAHGDAVMVPAGKQIIFDNIHSIPFSAYPKAVLPVGWERA